MDSSRSQSTIDQAAEDEAPRSSLLMGRVYMAISALCFASVGAVVKTIGHRASPLEKAAEHLWLRALLLSAYCHVLELAPDLHYTS